MENLLRWAGLTLAVPFLVWASAGVNVLRLTQATAEGPMIKAYVTVRDGQDQLPAQLDPGQLSVLVGSRHADVQSAMPVSKSKEGIGYIFLIDVSRSLTASQFGQIQKALIDWVGRMGSLDRAALITFGEQVTTRQDFTGERNTLETAIKGLAVTDKHTRLYDGLMAALDLSPARQGGPELPDRRAVIILSDGMNDAPGGLGATQDDVREKIRATHIPIYAIGFAGKPNSPEVQEGFRTLDGFARLSGGEFRAADNESRFLSTYAALRQGLEQTFVITARCTDCPLDGRSYPLQVSLSSGTRVFKDSMDLRMAQAATRSEVTPVPEPDAPFWPPRGWRLWAGMGAMAAILLLIGGVLLWRRRKRGHADRDGERTLTVTSEETPPRATQKITLTVVSGAAPGRAHRLYIEEAATLGRSPECDLVLDDDRDISGEHCRLELRDRTLFVSDLGSAYGTFLNGIRLYAPRPVEDGDKITLGRTEMRVSLTGVT